MLRPRIRKCQGNPATNLEIRQPLPDSWCMPASQGIESHPRQTIIARGPPFLVAFLNR